MPDTTWPPLEKLAIAWPIYRSAYGEDASGELIDTLLANGWDKRRAVAAVVAVATDTVGE